MESTRRVTGRSLARSLAPLIRYAPHCSLYSFVRLLARSPARSRAHAHGKALDAYIAVGMNASTSYGFYPRCAHLFASLRTDRSRCYKVSFHPFRSQAKILACELPWLKRLCDSWREIGFDQETVTTRIDALSLHLDKIWEGLVDEEDEIKANISERVETVSWRK